MQVNTAISTAAMTPFRIKAAKKVLVEAVVAPLRLDLGGGGGEQLHKTEREKKAYIWDCGGYGGKE